jgi:hypothetical protein
MDVLVPDMWQLIVARLVGCGAACVLPLAHVNKDFRALCQTAWCARYPYPGLCPPAAWDAWCKDFELGLMFKEMDQFRRESTEDKLFRHKMAHRLLTNSRVVGLAAFGSDALLDWYTSEIGVPDDRHVAMGLAKGGHWERAVEAHGSRIDTLECILVGLAMEDRCEALKALSSNGLPMVNTLLERSYGYLPMRFLDWAIRCDAVETCQWMRSRRWSSGHSYDSAVSLNSLVHVRSPRMLATIEAYGWDNPITKMVRHISYDDAKSAEAYLPMHLDYLDQRKKQGHEALFLVVNTQLLVALAHRPSLWERIQNSVGVRVDCNSLHIPYAITMPHLSDAVIDVLLGIQRYPVMTEWELACDLMTHNRRSRYEYAVRQLPTYENRDAWPRFCLWWKYGPAQADPWFMRVLAENGHDRTEPTELELDRVDRWFHVLTAKEPTEENLTACLGLPFRLHRLIYLWQKGHWVLYTRTMIASFMKTHFNITLYP